MLSMMNGFVPSPPHPKSGAKPRVAIINRGKRPNISTLTLAITTQPDSLISGDLSQQASGEKPQHMGVY
jgi:hypothetical protein